jgi:restriction system protein
MSIFRGWFGEKKTTFSMWLSLDKKTYHRYHDVIIPGSNGTTQIDHILVSRFGVFIVETKNKKGWIFGSEDQAKWTQSIYGKKYSFQNPLRQTFRQKKLLSTFLDLDEELIHPVVFFVGDCQFKTDLPDNILNARLGRFVKRFRKQVFTSVEVETLMRRLETHISSSSLTTRDHVLSLKQRHSSTTVCPNCGADLVERTAKKGGNAGSRFLGCTNYPRCRFTKSAL